MSFILENKNSQKKKERKEKKKRHKWRGTHVAICKSLPRISAALLTLLSTLYIHTSNLSSVFLVNHLFVADETHRFWWSLCLFQQLFLHGVFSMVVSFRGSEHLSRFAALFQLCERICFQALYTCCIDFLGRMYNRSVLFGSHRWCIFYS